MTDSTQHLMPCGHPESAVVSSGEGTAYCGECAERSQHSGSAASMVARAHMAEARVRELEEQIEGQKRLVIPGVEDALRDALYNDEKTICLVDYFMSDAPEHASQDFLDRPRLLADARILAVALAATRDQVVRLEEQYEVATRKRDEERMQRHVDLSALRDEKRGLLEQLEAASEAQDQATRNHAHLVSVLEGQRDELKEQLETAQTPAWDRLAAQENKRLQEQLEATKKERDYFRDRLPDFSRVQQAEFARAEELQEQLVALREALRPFAELDYYPMDGYFITHAWIDAAREALSPASSRDDCSNCDGKGRNTGWPHTTCPTCEGTGKELDPASEPSGR